MVLRGTHRRVPETSDRGRIPNFPPIVYFGGGGGDARPLPGAVRVGNLSVGLDPNWIAVHDFNGDGKADLGVSNFSSANLSIRLGVGNGTFTSAANVTVGTQPSFVAVGDFDGDGKADLAVPNNGSNNVSVRLGVGDGTFTSAADVAVGRPRSRWQRVI